MGTELRDRLGEIWVLRAKDQHKGRRRFRPGHVGADSAPCWDFLVVCGGSVALVLETPVWEKGKRRDCQDEKGISRPKSRVKAVCLRSALYEKQCRI